MNKDRMEKSQRTVETAEERERLKGEVEAMARNGGHTLSAWLEVGHAAQLGCLSCDRYAFVQFLPPPPRAHTEGLAAPCPDRGQRLIRMGD